MTVCLTKICFFKFVHSLFPIYDIAVVIYMVRTENKIVILITMYYKKEEAVVSDEYVDGLIEGYFINLLPEEV